MATTDYLCTLCTEDGVSNVAILWCSDCETFLCGDCATHHGRNKASKNHELVTTENLKKLPAFIQETGNKCVTHELMKEFYCQVHQIACCVHCIKSDHKDCRELVPLSDVLGNIKSSAAVSHLETDLKKLKSNYALAMKAISDKKANVQEEKMKCFEEIRQVRQKINSHLDLIEKKLEEDLSSKCSQIVAKIENLQDEIETKIKHVQQVDDGFFTIKLHGTNFQVFVAMRSYEKITEVEFNFLQNLQDGNELLLVNFDVDDSKVLEICDLKSFGKVKVGDVACSALFDIEKTMQVPISTSKIEDIHPRHINVLQVHSGDMGTIRDCLICPNGQKLFVDQSNNQLVRYSTDNNFIDKISLTNKPRSICYFDSGSIAISFYNQKIISVLELESQKIVKSFSVSYFCYGINIYCQHFYVSFADEGKIGILNTDGTMISLISVCGVNTTDMTDIAVFKNRIYGTNWKLNTISCYETNGVLLWTYKHDDIRGPRGLSLDKNSFVYVASAGSNKVFVIAPDGKNSKVILNGKNDIDEPTALHLNNELSLLLVGNLRNGRALLYQL